MHATCDLSKDNLADMVSKFEQSGISQILVEPVTSEAVDQYGIADVNSEELKSGQLLPMHKIVEKPPVDQAP
jgi:UTP--glucose-1-phosphate uridylyltransferase